MTDKKQLTRRDFLTLAGLAGVSLPLSKVVGKVGDDNLLYSPEQYGGFLIRQQDSGEKPYEVDDSVYQRFDQRNDVFSRATWDPVIMEKEGPFADVPVQKIMNNTKGFTRLDYAFYTAAWTVATTIGSDAGSVGASNGGLYSWNPMGGFVGRAHLYDLPPWQTEDWSPEEITDIVKTAAKFYGASLSGVAEVDERWLYSHRYSYGGTPTIAPGTSAPIRYEDAEAPMELEDGTLILPRSMKYVIALAFEMDEDGIDTVISGPSSAAVGNGYSRMTFTAPTLAEFIRGLGYQAVPSGNCTGMSIAYAVDAGLGELGRNGVLITPKFGPRVRLAKVFTDMPLVPDKPIKFGVEEFCNVCKKCAEHCPGAAISHGEKTFEPEYEAVHTSSNPGVKKWFVDTPACHQVWAEYGMDCATCIMVCPFNKPESWLHGATRALIGARSEAIDKVLVQLDNASGYGGQKDPNEFWRKKEIFIHTKEA